MLFFRKGEEWMKVPRGMSIQFRLVRRLTSSVGGERRRGRLTMVTPEVLREKDDEEMIGLYERIVEDRGKTGAKGGFPVMNKDKSLVGPWNAMVASPTIGSLAERMGNFCRHRNACASDLYEIGILVVGARWRSQFEWFAHEKLAKNAGVSEEAIRGIKESSTPEEMNGIMSENQKAVYKYATELHDTKRVSDTRHRDALKAVGSEQALIDLVFTMGFYHQISMTLNAFDIPLPPGEKLPFEEGS